MALLSALGTYKTDLGRNNADHHSTQWRSFEHGPRNCIAQGLVLTELRVVLALTARNFDIKPAYDEHDQLHPRKGLRAYRGERVYQIEEGAAHPVDKYPCRIHLRKV